MRNLFLHLSWYKVWVFIHDKFTGGVTLGTFNKEKMSRVEYSKNDTCQFLPIDSHFQYKIIDSYDK